MLTGHQDQAKVSHAMVLSTFDEDNDTLIFKNTYNDPSSGRSKRFKIRRTAPNAPEELYFVHIDIKDIENLPGQDTRQASLKKAQTIKQKTMEELTNESEGTSRPYLENFWRSSDHSPSVQSLYELHKN